MFIVIQIENSSVDIAKETSEKTNISTKKENKNSPLINVENFISNTEISEPNYTQEDLDLLSRVIYAEAGSSWTSDYHQQAVANVVINRVNSSKFPNTIREVIYQKGQYSCVSNGHINKTPDLRSIQNAKLILEGLRILPSNVIWQSTNIQGVIYDSIYDDILKNTTYFCY